MTLARMNAVRGTGNQWIYGLRIRADDGSVTVTAGHRSSGRSVTVEGVSPYRTTTLARRMGDKREGYESAIRKAIKAAAPRGKVSMPFTAAQEDAIRGIRAAFPPRKVMVRNRMLEARYALVQAAGSTWLVTEDGQILSANYGQEDS